MQNRVIVRDSKISKSFRADVVKGMFDIPSDFSNKKEWAFENKIPESWSIGLIVGPSGSGKTTIASELWPGEINRKHEWDSSKAFIESINTKMEVKQIVSVLCSVGLNSTPSWLKPFHCLSNGEQFRASLARSVIEREFIVFDEFTSVVDRQVAKIASHSIQKTIRASGKQFVAVSCHYDIVEWLNPDWVYQPETNTWEFPRGSLCRPPIEIEIFRCHRKAWDIFSQHHYLSHAINVSSCCFMALANGNPAGFCAWINHWGATGKSIRLHRIVTLPDWQGVGIGSTLNNLTASAYHALGCNVYVMTSHPGQMRSWNKSKNWKRTRVGFKNGKQTNNKAFHSSSSALRITGSFKYVGHKMRTESAKELVGA